MPFCINLLEFRLKHAYFYLPAPSMINAAILVIFFPDSHYYISGFIQKRVSTLLVFKIKSLTELRLAGEEAAKHKLPAPQQKQK